jgi:hypothetical protein
VFAKIRCFFSANASMRENATLSLRRPTAA